MHRTIGRILGIIALLFILGLPLYADATILNNSNDLLSATTPVRYGDQSFRERILERTGGERDPVALVLSGGSARAFAHIGVLQLLEEENVVPDLIISNSMGSIVGILYAAGISPEQIRTIISELDITQLFDLSFPLGGGMLDISRFLSLVSSYLGRDLRIEQLPIPIMIVCEDLATKRQVMIMEGDIATVMGAAFALPVYFSPVSYNGHLLVDGGITNLVPLDVAYEYSDTVIVSTTFYDATAVNLRNPLSILNVSIDIGKRRIGIGEVLARPGAIWIRCDVENFSFMDFSAVQDLARKGYDSAALHRERIGELDSIGVSEGMLSFREGFTEHERSVRSAYDLYHRTTQLSLSQQLFLGLKSYNFPGDRWFLRDDVIMGMRYQLRWRDLWLSVLGGAGWDSISPMAVYPEISASLSIQPISPLLIEGDVVISSERGMLDPGFYHRLGLELRNTWFDGSMRLGAIGWWEQQSDIGMQRESALVHAGITGSWRPNKDPRAALLVEAAWQLAGNLDRQFLHTRVDLSIPFEYDIMLNLGYTGRYAMDGGGTVPIYFGDGFKTADTALLGQGGIGSPSRSEQMMIIGRVGLDWQPSSFKPTAGELLIFERSSLGIFSDLLWNTQASFLPEFVVGARFSTTISLLGLNSMPVSMYVGYDNPGACVVWGFTFGR